MTNFFHKYSFGGSGHLWPLMEQEEGCTIYAVQPSSFCYCFNIVNHIVIN